MPPCNNLTSSSEKQSSTNKDVSCSEVPSSIRKEDYVRFAVNLSNQSFCNGCQSQSPAITSQKAMLKHFVKQITLPCTGKKEEIVIHPENNCRAVVTEAESSGSKDKNEIADLEDNSNKKKKKSLLRKYRGFMFAIMSSLCFSLTALIVKYLEDYSAVNLALWRFQGAFLPAIPLMVMHHCSKQNKRKLEGYEKKEKSKWSGLKICGLLVLRSIFTCNALLLHFYSLNYLSLGDAAVILGSTPVFAYIVAFLLLREPCGIVPIGTSITTLLGVIFILRPPIFTGQGSMDYNTMVGTCLAFGSTLLATISYCLLRYSRSVHYSLTTFFFGAWGTFENLIIALAFGIFSLPHGTKHWWMGGALAALTFFGQISIILALKYEKAGPVTLIKTVDVLFGFMWQMLFFQLVPDLFSIIGASIVVCGVFVIGVRKWIGTLPEDDGVRIKFAFMLK